MKQTAMKSAVLAAMAVSSSGAALAADYKQNPFTLAYIGAITKNEPGKVNIHPVTYKLYGLSISANVYTPADYAPKHGGVKEQVAAQTPSALRLKKSESSMPPSPARRSTVRDCRQAC